MNTNISKYKLVLGLEVHMHVKTQTKMFCSCSAAIYNDEANTHTCPVCLALPGALPVPSLDAIKKTQLLGLSLGCTLNKESKFDRKHYFYPDLPKGYQISQYKEPFCENGKLALDDGTVISIERVHLEEDTAKSFHEGGKTLIDFNKSGMPLIEIVTAPDFRSTDHAVEFCKKIYELVKTLGVSDADMEKGQMRLEANISLRTEDMELENNLPDYKVEIKNINSFRFMEKAVLAEIKRQTALLDKGEKVFQENRGFNEATGETVAQRSKEDAKDYRYFPEPDIPPMVFDDDYIDQLKSFLPELPQELQTRLVNDFAISLKAAYELSKFDNKELLTTFMELVGRKFEPVKIVNFLLNKQGARDMTVDEISGLLTTVVSDFTNEELEELANKVIADNQSAVINYKSGKEGSLMFLVGQIMSLSKGKADPEASKTLLRELLK